MTRIDRYILFLYFRILAICFASVAGLLIVVEIFTNLDEFARYGERSGHGIFPVLVEYFTPRIFDTFEGMSGLLALLALLFVVAWLNKTNEFTALLAAGVTKRRVIKPLLAASILVILSAALIRELIVPSYRDELQRRPQDLTGEMPRAMRPVYDASTQILLRGKSLFPAKYEVLAPNFRVYGGPIHEQLGASIEAERANYVAATSEHPAGYILRGITKPADLSDVAAVQIDGKPALETPSSASWLGAGEYFVSSEIGYESLRGGNAAKQYASTLALVDLLKSEPENKGRSIKVKIHTRLLRPFVDWTVLLLGIPVLLARPDRHMFWIAGSCIGIVAVFSVICLGVAALGTSGAIPPILAGWAPIVAFLPIGWARTQQAYET